MILETPRLFITEITSEDISHIHEMNSYPEVARFNTIGIPKDISETQKLLQPFIDDQKKEIRTQFGWAIKLKGTHEFIGQIAMFLSSEKYRSGEISYGLTPLYWKKGYAIESAKAIVHFGFKTLGLHRIIAGVATENNSSIAILDKLGMTREGHHRKILPLKSGWADNYEYAILEEDPRDY